MTKNFSKVPDKLTKRQQEILNGLLLGDGCIQYSSQSSMYPRLTMCRQGSDVEYLWWQFREFRKFYSNPPKVRDVPDKRTGKIYKSAGLISKISSIFEYYRNHWYPDGKKEVPRDLELTPLTIAIWFCDDGNMRFNDYKETSVATRFNTQGFRYDDVVFLAGLLTKRYGEDFRIHGKEGIGWIIKTSSCGSEKISKDIDKCIPAGMSRKAFWRGKQANKILFVERKVRIKLTDLQVKEIRKLRKHGMKLRVIAEKFSISLGYVWNLCKNHYRKDA